MSQLLSISNCRNLHQSCAYIDALNISMEENHKTLEYNFSQIHENKFSLSSIMSTNI